MTASAFLDVPEDDFDRPDEPWFIEPKDHDPRSETKRQQAFLSALARQAPGCSAFAVPNAGKRSDWERLQRHREGARAGVPDLIITWNHGIFFAEFKDGQKSATREQRDRLNTLYRQGFRCGVYRNGETLLHHLREAGAPFLGEARAVGDIAHGIVAKARRP